MSYEQVSAALRAGADPAMLCMTCPWDRYCVSPPQMTHAEVDAQLKKAAERDKVRAAAAGKSGTPVQTLLTILAVGGEDMRSFVCPVFAMRLRTQEGRGMTDAIKAQMQALPAASGEDRPA